MCACSAIGHRFFEHSELKRFAVGPGKQPGKYARHVSKALNLAGDHQHLYRLPIAVHRRHDLERSIYDMPAIPAHEAISRELDDDPSVTIKLLEMLQESALPPAYFEHTIVRSGGGL